jgi:hypothetical protein
LYDKFIYPKGTTVSGTTPVVGSGQLGALHTHTFNIKAAVTVLQFTFSSCNNASPVSYETEEVGEVSHVQNEQNKVSFFQLNTGSFRCC